MKYNFDDYKSKTFGYWKVINEAKKGKRSERTYGFHINHGIAA